MFQDRQGGGGELQQALPELDSGGLEQPRHRLQPQLQRGGRRLLAVPPGTQALH